MDALIIKGPSKLSGSVEVSGSKNASLPLLFASLLFQKEIKFSNIPRLWDIETTLEILKTLGAETQWNKLEGTLAIKADIQSTVAPYELVKKMRASILALCPLVAMKGHAKVSLPGGCAIGARPVDYHLEAMKKMGVEIEIAEGYIHAKVKKSIQGAEIDFPKVSVTGTENILILACFAKGQTRILNAAREPEVVTLGEFLIQCGAKISGLGTSELLIEESSLTAPESVFEIPPDRIETGTWIAASCITNSPLFITQTDSRLLKSVIETFERMGTRFECSSDFKTIRVLPTEDMLPVEIQTEVYPSFPTDMQAQLMSVLCLAKGISCIQENIFENRFMHVAELKRLNARIDISDKKAFISGPCEFKAAPVMATDLRASASLVLAALAAKGETRISRIYHLDRGYQRLDEKLRKLGADISRISE
jgi:UDP-N-acetylglucosamine 1-carboxyvinyltransferase